MSLGDENHNPDENFRSNETDADYTGSEVLNEIGIANIHHTVRAVLIDRINDEVGARYNGRVGPAIDAIAQAHRQWRRVRTAVHRGHPDAQGDPHIALWGTRIRRRLVTAQREYRMLAGGCTRTDGPEQDLRDQGSR